MDLQAYVCVTHLRYVLCFLPLTEYHTVCITNLTLYQLPINAYNVSNQSLVEYSGSLSSEHCRQCYIDDLVPQPLGMNENTPAGENSGYGLSRLRVRYIVFRDNANLPFIEREPISLLSATAIANLVCFWVL